MKSIKPRKQRKQLYNAPLHKKRKWLAAHLSENLLLKYNRRSVPVIKGDTVKIMRGIFKGHENKVTKVNVKKGFVEVEGVTLTKADGKKVARPIHPSNLLITKLNLADKWRRHKLEQGLPEETKEEIEEEGIEQERELEEEKHRSEEESKKREGNVEEPSEEVSKEIVEEESEEENEEGDKKKDSEESLGKSTEKPKEKEDD